MQLSEQLVHTTIRIESEVPGGIATGTGFFFDFCNEGGRSVPTIVTNKHVLKDSIRLHLVFTLADAEGNPIDAYERFEVQNSPAAWINHPDPTVDLCALPIAPVINALEFAGKRICKASLTSDIIPKEADIDSFSFVDEITMVGYPNGLWDSRNNLPIVRRGITATPYRYDYQGRREFLIDSACFPGSSGSPVFLYNEGAYGHAGGLTLGTRIFFLGVLYSGPTTDLEGEIVLESRPKIVTKSMLNLGFVIKASRMLEFEPIIKAMA